MTRGVERRAGWDVESRVEGGKVGMGTKRRKVCGNGLVRREDGSRKGRRGSRK
jgi:hypothetical protein